MTSGEDFRWSRYGMVAIVTFMAACIALAAWTGRDGEFGRYVLRPMPGSVRGVQVESNDWPLGLNPEPVVNIRFQASAEDLGRIVAGLKLEERPVDAGWLSGRGPAWWNPPLRMEGTRCFQGANRRGQIYLVLDGAGTNAWFLLWGI